MTKPIILAIILCVIQGVKKIFDEVRYQTFWSCLPVCNVASDWPTPFLHPRSVFLFSISLLFVTNITTL